jgi:predicted DNA binding CopG/RHH family protein
MKPKIPTFSDDDAAEAFVSGADLTEFDLSSAQMMRFELKPKDRSINLRLPEGLLAAVRAQAAGEGVPYQRYIRHVLEEALAVKRRV